MPITTAPPPGIAWPSGVYPAGIWPQGIWPDGTSLLPLSLLAAVRADYVAAGLETTAGPFRAGRAGRGESPPHVVVNVAGSGPSIATAAGQIDEARLHFRCRASTATASRDMATAIDAWMLAGTGRRFRWANGFSGPAFRDGWTKGTEPGLDPNGKPVFFDLLSYRLLVRGPR